MNRSRIWALGAPDPEMEAIERILRAADEAVLYATADGRRVHPGSAYRADGVIGADGAVYTPLPGGVDPHSIRWVECEIPGLPRDHVIDHHRPGDTGYGRPPAEFLPASSIGQLIAELARLAFAASSYRILDWDHVSAGSHDGEYSAHVVSEQRRELCTVPSEIEDGIHPGAYVRVRDVGWLVGTYTAGHECGGCWDYAIVPHDLVLAAAADHCLGAAYRGECPGVEPDDLMEWRAESRAKYQGRQVADVLADIRYAQQELRTAKKLTIGGWTLHEVRDMRRDKPIPELPEAATRLGLGYIAGPIPAPDGREKYTCSGTFEQVKLFMELWAPANGLVGIYGDPVRGFAGGYAEE